MSEFVPVCKINDLPDPGRIVVEVDDHIVALFHVQGQYWAIDDQCTHDGGPLADGKLTGFVIHCPRHGAQFDIRTGRVLSLPATHDTPAYEVKIEDDTVYVKANHG